MIAAHLYEIRRPTSKRWFTGAYICSDTDFHTKPTFIFDIRNTFLTEVSRVFDPTFPYRTFSATEWDITETTASKAVGWVATRHGLHENVEAAIREFL